MKKIISVLLALVMLVSVFQVTLAASAADQNENLPIVFVTGIGQTFSHVRADSAEDADYFYPYKESPDGEVEYIPCVGGKTKGQNIFITDIVGSLLNIAKSPTKFIKSFCGIAQLLQSIFTGTYTLKDENLATILREILCLMTVDENGNLSDDVFVPFYDYPVENYLTNEDVAQLPQQKYAQSPKERFNSMVGHTEEIKKYGEDRVFCFNYAPYGSIEQLTDKLDAYIDNLQEEYFPDKKVILVPMSMGATLVSNYLYKYGNKADVAKVISVVGCWQGSDLFADLIEGKYAENSPEIFYTEMFSGLFNGDGIGSLVSILAHCMSKETLTPALKTVARLASEEFILKTPTMLGLIPPDRYEAIRANYLTRPGYEKSLAEADEYHKAQVAVKDTMKKLNEEQGVDFYFIAGYELGFGDVSYAYFKCFESAPTTNSDEIIQIESTTIGAISVAPGTQFSEEYINAAKAAGTDKYISPEKSVDLSTAIFPDNCFLFKGQKHELEHNTTAITLAVKIALGEITDIYSNPEYPQYSTKIDNDTNEPDEWDYYLSIVTKPLHKVLYYFTGPKGIPDLFKK